MSGPEALALSALLFLVTGTLVGLAGVHSDIDWSEWMLRFDWILITGLALIVLGGLRFLGALLWAIWSGVAW